MEIVSATVVIACAGGILYCTTLMASKLEKQHKEIERLNALLNK